MNHSVNQKLLSLWKKYFENRNDIPCPLFYKNIENTGAVLFIGINPSFNKDYLSKISDHKSLTHDTIRLTNELLYDWINFKSEHIELIAQADSLGKEKILSGEKSKTRHNFFIKHQEIIDYLNDTRGENMKLEWEHIDLFHYRMTSLKHFKTMLFEKKALNDFALEQIIISKELIENIQPSVIIVANALASEFFKKYVYTNNELSESIDGIKGYHLLNLNKKSIPVFFSSMLTNGVLDNHSFERLQWHVKKAILDQNI